MADCGLSLPPLPGARPGGPQGVDRRTSAPTEQWRVARQHWEEILALWQGRFDSARQEATGNDMYY